MAVPRDPQFWKRFSYAVHLDEEAQVTKKRPESWHHSTVRKNRHSHLCVCLTFWIILFAIIAIIVVTFLVLIKTGVLQKIHIGGDGHRVDIDLQGWWQRTFGGSGWGAGGGEKGGSEGGSG